MEGWPLVSDRSTHPPRCSGLHKPEQVKARAAVGRGAGLPWLPRLTCNDRLHGKRPKIVVDAASARKKTPPPPPPVISSRSLSRQLSSLVPSILATISLAA